MKHALALVTVLLSQSVWAEALIIEFKQIPSSADIHTLSELSGVADVARFSNFNSDYFSRVYRLDLNASVKTDVVTETLKHSEKWNHAINKIERI